MARGKFSRLICEAMKGNPVLPAPKPHSAPLPSQTYPRQRILTANDNGGARHVTAKLLTRWGYEVDTAEDGAAAWDRLQLNRYHLLIADHNMPKVPGVELLKKLRAARMDVPVIMATAPLPKAEFSRCPLPQPDATLLKPNRVAQLLETVREFCARPAFPASRAALSQNRQSQPSGDGLRQ